MQLTEGPVSGQRNHFFPLIGGLFVLLHAPLAWAEAPAILLPEPFVVEMPAGRTSLGPGDEPLRSVLASARAGKHRVTATLPRDQIGVGVWRVILSAWEETSSVLPAARRETPLFVLPAGMSVVAVTGHTNATAGNNATHIARDAGGDVHMVWVDSWGPYQRDGAWYRRARTLSDGSVRFETEAVPLASRAGGFTAMPSLTAAGDTVHFVWQVDNAVWYRNLKRDGTIWRWSDEIDTGARSARRDIGPSVAVDVLGGIHVLSTDAIYAFSTDGGKRWTLEPLPLGEGREAKTTSLSLDREGRPLVVASVIPTGGKPLSEAHGTGAHWPVLVFRRTAPGRWETVRGPLEGWREWEPPTLEAEDVLADWVRLMEDSSGGLHATWHGTAVSRVYGNDHAYYAWRPPGGAWNPPVPLREPDPEQGYGWSYAPGLTLMGETALPLVFYMVQARQSERGFDSDLNAFHRGKRVGTPLPVNRSARDSLIAGEPMGALSAWFPGAAPALWHGEDGRIWMDVLVTLFPTGIAAPGMVVYQRVDVTEWLKAARP